MSIERSLPSVLKRGVILPLCLAVLFGYMLGLIAPYVATDKPATPFFIIGVLLIPITICTTLIFKLIDLKKLCGLSRTEKRRLEPMITSKVNRLIFLVVFYFISAVIIGFVFFSSSLMAVPSMLLMALRGTGALLGLALATILFSIFDTIEASDFQGKLESRNTERKLKADLLKRLEGTQEH